MKISLQHPLIYSAPFVLCLLGAIGCAAPAPSRFADEMKRIKSIEGGIGKQETGALGRAISEQNVWLARRWVDIDRALDDSELSRAAELIAEIAAVDPSNPRLKGARLSLQSKSAQPKQSLAPQVVSTPQVSEVDIAVGKVLPVLEFRDAPLSAVMETLGRIGELNFVFDKDVRTDTRVSVSLKDAAIKDALKAILVTQQLEFKVLNRNSILIFPNTAAKIRDYVDLQSRSFFLDNIDAKQALALIRTMVKTRDIFIDEKLNLLVMKDSPAAIRYAEQLIESVDQAEPEVLLDVQVLEVTASRTSELGLKLPTSATLELPFSNPAAALTRRNWADQIITTASPSISASLRAGLGDANLLSNPSIRVKNREKARIHVGEKLPVFTSNFSASAIAGGTSNAFSTQVTLLEVGLKLDVEPIIHTSKEVEIKLALEVSNVIEKVAGPAQSVGYRVGTRNAVTNLRLRDGETQILAGLIREDERRSVTGVPGLMELPLLGRLFGPQTTEKDKTEIILLITPRIVRSIEAPLSARSSMNAGTEGAVGIAPFRMSNSTEISVAAGGAGGNRSGASVNSRARQPRSPVAAASVNPSKISLSLAGPTVVKAGTEFEVVLVRTPGQEAFEAVVEMGLTGEGATFAAGGTNTVNLGTEQSSIRLKSGAVGSEIEISIGSARFSGGDLPLDGGPRTLKIKVQP